MIKTTLKIDGMMCGMCESHMNDVIRKNFKVKKVTSSARDILNIQYFFEATIKVNIYDGLYIDFSEIDVLLN